MDLQELITRGRFLFNGAPKRLEVFKNVDGKRNTKEIAEASKRSHVAALIDLKKMEECGLIQAKILEGKTLKKDGCMVFEKIPLLNHVSLSYFRDNSKARPTNVEDVKSNKRAPNLRKDRQLKSPSVTELLDICREGEDQTHEFKDPRVETEKITKEIAAFLNTRKGGLLFYGIADDGSILGTGVRRQDFDQAIQNSVRSTIAPQPNIEIKEIEVMGQKVLVVVIPPWNRKTPYQYTKDNRFYIRKGGNVFALTAEEISKLGKGEYVV